MKDELETALALIYDVQEELAFEDALLNGTLSQSIFDKLARVSNIMEKVYSTVQYNHNTREELDFERDNEYQTTEDEEGVD